MATVTFTTVNAANGGVTTTIVNLGQTGRLKAAAVTPIAVSQAPVTARLEFGDNIGGDYITLASGVVRSDSVTSLDTVQWWGDLPLKINTGQSVLRVQTVNNTGGVVNHAISWCVE